MWCKFSTRRGTKRTLIPMPVPHRKTDAEAKRAARGWSEWAVAPRTVNATFQARAPANSGSEPVAVAVVRLTGVEDVGRVLREILIAGRGDAARRAVQHVHCAGVDGHVEVFVGDTDRQVGIVVAVEVT